MRIVIDTDVIMKFYTWPFRALFRGINYLGHRAYQSKYYWFLGLIYFPGAVAWMNFVAFFHKNDYLPYWYKIFVIIGSLVLVPATIQSYWLVYCYIWNRPRYEKFLEIHKPEATVDTENGVVTLKEPLPVDNSLKIGYTTIEDKKPE